jgi:hypothetical protein
MKDTAHRRGQEVRVMEFFTTLGPVWANVIAAAFAIFGFQLVWRGLRGGPHGERALLLRRTDMLSRMEGFRLTVFGLVLLGVAASIVWQAQWLLLLALGIGFVEILESSTLIAVWKRGPRRSRDAPDGRLARDGARG